MSSPRMIVTDLDGTLLTRAGHVSDRTAAVLRRAKEAGAVVVVATGRPTWWLDPVLDIGFDGTAVCLNGAAIYDTADKQLVSVSPLTPPQMQEFVGALDQRLPGLAVAVERVGTTDEVCWGEPHYEHPWDDGDFPPMPRAELLSEPALKMLVRHGNDSSVLAAAATGTGVPEVSVTYSTDAGLIEVGAAGVNKGSALARLAGGLGIDAADVIAFGDMPNDREMLQWAGRSYAMDNAHPIALAAAGDRAADNDADGVAQVLERWF